MVVVDGGQDDWMHFDWLLLTGYLSQLAFHKLY